MRFSILVAGCFALTAAAQECGPQKGNQICAPQNCCSQYGWCDTDAAHCDPATCLPEWSGQGSTCKPKSSTTVTNPLTSTTAKNPPTSTTAKTGTSSSTTTSSSTAKPYESSIPVIDVCGHAEGGVNCPGAGTNGYFYRCCSSGGHCGPKNPIQDQALYCGTGCQAGYGDCSTNKKAPAVPKGPVKIAQTGQTCGQIVNARCATGLCCSGSNFCGTGVDFCGAANWCQSKWGVCSGS